MQKTILTLAALAALPLFAQQQEWQIDTAHTTAEFTVRHMMISNVKGSLGKVSGTVKFDPAKWEDTAVDATIDITAVNTREEGRDKHLRSADFFDVEKYPKAHFVSKRVVRSGGKLQLIGDLTMKDVTKEVTLDVDPPLAPQKDARGRLHSGASATTTLNRKDFHINYSALLDGGGVVVSDDVKVAIDIEMVPVAPKPATP